MANDYIEPYSGLVPSDPTVDDMKHTLLEDKHSLVIPEVIEVMILVKFLFIVCIRNAA